MINKKLVFISLVSLIFQFIILTAGAQTINEVIQAFNTGAEEVNSGNFEGAIAKFEECITLATNLGAEGDEMKTKAMEQIPQLHYRIALDRYKAKDIEGAIAKFEETVAVCETFPNDSIKGKSLKYIPQLYYVKGNNHLKNAEYSEALASFDKAIEYEPDYAKAYYSKGLAYKNMDDADKMFSTMEKTIEISNTSGDDKTAAAAAKILRDYLLVEGMKSMKNEDYENAVSRFNETLKYDNKFADPYYYLSVIYNKQLEYEKAAENAEKALLYDDSDPEKKARIYYELGNAYIGMVEYAKACEAFKNALYEPYLNTVKHKMDNVLNCQ